MVLRDPASAVVQTLALSDGFLRHATLRQVSGGVLVEGAYNATRFHPDLFDALEIPRPKSLARAVDKRLAEFLAGRAMAKLAQEALGHAPQEIKIGPDRAPIWPLGVAGSISHARGFCACLALPSGPRCPGLDIEAIAEGHALDAIFKVALSPDEADLLTKSPSPDLTATLVFSAKETLFKALYPTVRRYFGFSSAELRALPDEGRLTLHLCKPLHSTLPASRQFDIAYDVRSDHVLTRMVYDCTGMGA